MYVYLKLGQNVKCVSGVTLQDAYCPMVGDIGQSYQLEPAIWFKTLIIDSILIDCNQRLVRWGRTSVTESSVHNDFSGRFQDRSFISEPDNIVDLESLDLRRTVFEDGDCYDFEPKADELFDSASRLVESFVTQQVEEVEFKTEILRLLHCYVLPSIQLTRDDINPLQNALQFTEKKLQTLENDVLSKDRANIITENSLKKQRDRLINNEAFDKESYIKTCNSEFLQTFLKHVNKDIDEISETLQNQQAVVDFLRDSTAEEEKRKLSETRKERNKTHSELEKLQLIRENIKNVIIRSHPTGNNNRKSRKVKQKPNVFHEIYLEISSRLQAEKDAMHKLCLRKVKISSVREAIFLTLDQLKLERSTFGWEANSIGTESATNVLSNLGIPESWRSLEEQVSQLLANPEILAHARFELFCESIHQKIQGSFQEAALFMSTPSPISPRSNLSDSNKDIESSDDFVDVCSFVDALNDASNVCVNRRPKTMRSLSETSVRSTSTEYEVATLPYRSMLDVIKKDIIEHVKEICQILINLMPEYVKLHGNAIYNKVWVCYEKHLYHRIMDEIQELYWKAYDKVSASIRTKLTHLSYSELGIDDAWLIKMEDYQICSNVCQENDECTEVKQPIDEEEDDFEHVQRPSLASTSTVISLDKLSLGELYECADKDCNDLKIYLDGALQSDEMAVGCEPEIEIDGARGITLPNGPPSYNQACSKTDSPPPYMLDQNRIENDRESEQAGAYSVPEQTTTKLLYEKNRHESHDHIPLVIKPFSPVLEYVSNSLECKTVLSKLKQITKAFRFMGKQVSLLKNNVSSEKNGYMACCDDILTVTIIVLKCLDEETFQQFYSQINLIIDLMPPFMAGSVHDCSLTNFCCAFQYLMDRQVIRQSREMTS